MSVTGTPSHASRLQTFKSSPFREDLNLNFSNSPLKLAEAGFSRAETPTLDDEVECKMCGGKYKEWEGESPIVVHRVLNPYCPFLNTPQSRFTNGFLMNGHNNSSSSSRENVRRKLFPTNGSVSTFSSVPEIQHPFQPKHGGYVMLFESLRLLSFKNPLATEAEIYAKGGFLFNSELRKVMCVFCDLKLEYDATNRSASFLDSLHREKSPLCPFIQLFDTGNVSREDERKIREKISNQHSQDNLNKSENENESYVIKYPQYEEKLKREGTFVEWPKLQDLMFPASLMTDAGFYYTGYQDKVTCYACGVSLFSWVPCDPYVQHIKASPHCLHMAQTKGKEFLEEAQKKELVVKVDLVKSGPSAAQAATAAASTPSSSSPSTSTPSSTSSLSPSAAATSAPGSPVLDLNAIKAAMACQYSLEQITHAIRQFFDSTCGLYPNEELLIGTLKAADENYRQLCKQRQEIISKDELMKTKEAAYQQKEVTYQRKEVAYLQEIQATKTELHRTQRELQLRSPEGRSELEQQILQRDEVIEHKDQVIEHKDQQLEHKDLVIEQHRGEIEQNKLMLEMKSKTVQDLERHIESLRAELERRDHGPAVSDDDSLSSDGEHHSESESSVEDFPVADCKVCRVRASQVVFLPCKHLCCCDFCASRLVGQGCPICREPNQNFEMVYVV